MKINLHLTDVKPAFIDNQAVFHVVMETIIKHEEINAFISLLSDRHVLSLEKERIKKEMNE
jgi:hypothetical protein